MLNYFKCSSCNTSKIKDDFYLHSNGSLRKQCKNCVKSRRKKVSNEITKRASEKYRNENYELCLQKSREWRKSNLEYDAFRAATYRATKRHQTPSWADLNKIKEIYMNCPKGYHVDHIVPLRGKIVNGLHVESNLQYLPAKENLIKRNFYYA